MCAAPLGLDSLDLNRSLSLVVLRTVGKGFERQSVNIAGEAAEFLRQACAKKVASLQDKDPQQFSSDMELPTNGYILVEDGKELISGSPLGAALFAEEEANWLDARALKPRQVPLYAVITDIDTSATSIERRAFVRKHSPSQNVRHGSMLGLFHSNVLTRIDDPVFQLDGEFDLILSPNGAIATDLDMFDSLFRDNPEMLKKIPEWVRSLSDAVPLDGGLQQRLAAKCQTNATVRRRLRSILEQLRGTPCSIADLSDYAKQHGLDTHISFDDGMINAGDAYIEELLHLLGQNYFIGPITRDAFRAARKSRHTIPQNIPSQGATQGPGSAISP